MKKGFAHLIPIIAIALVLGATAYIAASAQKNNSNQNQVLSSSEENKQAEEQQKEQQKQAEEQQKQAEESRKEAEKSDNSGSSNSNKTKVESRSGQTQTEVETENGKTKVKIESEGQKFESETENGKAEIKTRLGGLRVEYKREGNKVVVKFKNEQGQEVEVGNEEKDKLLKEAENEAANELESQGIELATESGRLDIIQNGRRVRTNFPLSVDPVTGELHVNTPSGEKVVTVLPDNAIQNMIRAGFPIIETPEPSPTPQATPSASPGGTTEASQQTEVSGVELTEVDNQLAYVIDAAKNERVLGVVPVQIKVKGVVSAENGNLLEVRRSIISRILDAFSF